MVAGSQFISNTQRFKKPKKAEVPEAGSYDVNKKVFRRQQRFRVRDQMWV